MKKIMNKQKLLEMTQNTDVENLEIWKYTDSTLPEILYLTINKSQYIVKNKQGEQTFCMNKTAISFTTLCDFLGVE